MYTFRIIDKHALIKTLHQLSTVLHYFHNGNQVKSKRLNISQCRNG